MTLAWIIYFIDVLCDNKLFGFLTAVLTLLWVIGFVASITAKLCGETDKEAVDYLALYKSLWPLKVVTGILLLYTMLIPSKETAYKMLAAYGVESIVTNEKVQELGGKSLEVLEKAMGEYLDEGKDISADTKESK